MIINPKNITNNARLAEFLELTDADLDFFINTNLKSFDTDEEIKNLNKREYPYKRIIFDKINGEKRIVFMVSDQKLSNAQRMIKGILDFNYKNPDFVYGFIKGRSHIDNAKNHLAKKYITKVDIKDFFPSIKREKVKQVFLCIGFNADISEKLTKITTFQDVLVQGFCTSPVISNMVLIGLDNKAIQYSKENNLTYTRYGDDLTFSSNTNKPDINFIEVALKHDGFQINKNKTKNMGRGMLQIVTGLSVFDNNYPRIPKKIKRRLRLQMYYIEKFGSVSHFNRNCSGVNKKHICDLDGIAGWIYYINSVEPALYQKYRPIIDSERNRINEIYANYIDLDL
jgi:hypothetical protein